jgi:DNA-binding SARP family transcriptional activator
MLNELHAGLAPAITGARWTTLDGALHALRSVRRAITIVVDDAHELEGSPAEADLVEMVRRGPRTVRLFVGTRSVPRYDVSRLRASGDLLEVTADDLRFRSWEVEELFRDVYGDPLGPEEAVDLARRTGGWAACLHLFRIAFGGRSPALRRTAVASVEGPPQIVASYLGANVTFGLPAPLAAFLRDVSVLTTLTPALCDDFLDRDDSARLLDELARLGLVVPSSKSTSWRCLEPLRSYLEQQLVDEVGQEGAGVRHARAAEVLERSGMPGEALRAYARAGAWTAAHTLAWRHGRELGEGGAAWIEPAPPAMLRRDPWLLLGSARWLRSRGRPIEAIVAYRDAEREFGATGAACVCRDERAALACWMDLQERPSRDWVGSLRVALTVAGSRIDTGGASPVHARLAAGLDAVARGDVRRALASLPWVADHPRVSHAAAVSARVALAAALLLGGDESGAAEARRAAEEAETLELPWLVRCARMVLALTTDGDGPAQAALAKRAADAARDAPGSIVGALLLGLGALRRGDDARLHLDEAAALARRLGLGLIETWARAARALEAVRAREEGSLDLAVATEADARRWESPGAQAFALLAAAEAGDTGRAATARSVAARVGLALPHQRPDAVRPTVRIWCFGGLRVTVDGADIDLGGLKPRARQVLRLLLLRAPQPVHREILVDTLWPHLPEARATASLHVTLSSLRHALEDAGGPQLIRDADAYALDLEEVDVDLVAFRDATSGQAFAPALDLYRGELFPEEGPAEWVVGPREHLRGRAVRAAREAAEELLPLDPVGAAAVCERGLELDRDCDDLWRLLIEAQQQAGNLAAAARASVRYRAVLESLGVASAAGWRG